MLSRHRRTLSWLVGAVLVVLAGRLLLRNPEPLRKLATLPPSLWLALLPLTLLNLVFMAWRLSLSVGQVSDTRIPAVAWFRIVLLGQFLNLFVPQLGNVYRGVTLKREFSVTYTAYATGLFTFVWLDTAFGFVLCLSVLLLLEPGLRLAGFPIVPMIAVLAVLLLSAPVVASRLLAKLQLAHDRLAKWKGRVDTLLTTAARKLKTPAFMTRFLLGSALLMANQSTILWICFRAVGMPIEPETAVLFQVLVKLSNQVVVTPGNLGLTELAFGLLGSAAHGGSVEYGIAAALVFRVLSSSCVIGLGILFGGAGLLRMKPVAEPELDAERQA
jgi:uncharacterized membrane protein YbhN (UPF0104 family)